MKRLAALLAAGALMLALPGGVFAADEVFTATLTGDAQVPPLDVDGTGKATVTISDDESTISWDVTYSGLTGAPGAGHIHFGAVDATGPVMIPFATVTATGSSGSFAAADYATGEGLPADWAGVLAAIRAGDTYVNIHTEANGAGEIRGQLAASSAPPTDTGAAATDQPQPGSSVPLALLVMVAAVALAVGLRRFATR